MLKDSSSGSDYIMTTEKSRCFNDVTMSDYFGAALFYHFPGYGSSCYYYERCDVSSSYTPDWLTSSDSYGQSDGIEYITIAYTDSSGDTSAVISGLDDSCAEADVGLGALESGTAWFDSDDGYSGGQTQDIGGPTHCSSAYDDSSCADTYPDTVYYFVREATPRHHVTGTSCKNILDNNPEIEGMDGTYTIEHSDGSTYQAYCDMTSDDGGWQLVAKMSNYDDKNWCTSYDDWTSTDVYGDTADIYDIGNDAKGFGWSDVTATQMMFRDSYSQTQYCRTAEDIDSQTMAEYFASALDTGFPGYGGSCDYYQKLTTTCSNDWVPSWLTDGSSNAQDPIEYLLISYTDNSGDTSAVISGFSDSCGEADVGIGSLEGGMSWYDSSDGYSGGLSQDIGSPTECSYDDDTCFYTDHQTAFVFVRGNSIIDRVEYSVGSSDDYSSCFELLNADDSYYEQDGTYTFTTSGGVSYQAYCDMTTDGGGWTLAAKMANSDLDKNWVNGADDWTSSTTYGDVTQIGTDDADAKGRAWSTVKANQIMLKDSSSGSDYIMTTEKSRCFNDVTMSDYFGAALFYHFPGYGSSCYYYERCDVSSSYTPDWLTSSDSYGQSDGIEYITIAYTDSSGDTSAVISGLDDSCAEADVGLGALESGTAWFDSDDGYSGGQTQDIGGPTHCSSAYDDSSCAD